MEQNTPDSKHRAIFTGPGPDQTDILNAEARQRAKAKADDHTDRLNAEDLEITKIGVSLKVTVLPHPAAEE